MAHVESASRDASTAIHVHDIPAERPWSYVLKKGQTLRIIDSQGQQAVDALLYCAADPTERYSAQDTLRTQGSAYVDVGTRLISNRGRVMARITADTCGRHDTSAGCCSCESNAVRFGEADQVPARLPRELHSRALQIWPGQARYRRQPELLHERADRSQRQFHRGRRHFGAWDLSRRRDGDGRHFRHFELPAGEQSLQWIRSDADTGHDLGRGKVVARLRKRAWADAAQVNRRRG